MQFNKKIKFFCVIGSFLNFLTLQLDGKKDILYVKHTFYLQIFFYWNKCGNNNSLLCFDTVGLGIRKSIQV